jgi:hypothetical protein
MRNPIMATRDDALSLARRTALASYAWAQAARPAAPAWAALHLGDEVSALALGTAAQPARVIDVDLGLATLARRFFASDRPGEAAIETAIAEVEEAIMPLRPALPAEAWLVSTDAAVADVAVQAGLSLDAGPVTLDRETVEALFNRWAALALGRPASQDALPIGGRWPAALPPRCWCCANGCTTCRRPSSPWPGRRP